MKKVFKKWFGWLAEGGRPKLIVIGFLICFWFGIAAVFTASFAAEYKDWCYAGRPGGVFGWIKGKGFDWLDLASTMIGGLLGLIFHYNIFNAI